MIHFESYVLPSMLYMEHIPIRKIRENGASGEIFQNVKMLKINQSSRNGALYQPVHRHDFFFLMAIEKGDGRHQIDFSQYDVAEYMVFFMRPGQIHTLELSNKSKGFIVEFSPTMFYSIGDDINSLLRKIGRQNLFVFNRLNFARFSSILENMFREYNDKNLHSDKAFISYLKLSLIELSRLKSNSSASLDDNHPYLLERLEEFQELLESKISEIKKVSAYAKMMNLTAYQLNKITKTTLNKTCSALINEQIVLESKRQLLSTSNQISHIAFKMGYEDVSYFTRVFKKHVGYSPIEFREKFA